jgi:hypothetical protein
VALRWNEDLAFGSQLVTEDWEKVKGSGWGRAFQARMLPFLARIQDYGATDDVAMVFKVNNVTG